MESTASEQIPSDEKPTFQADIFLLTDPDHSIRTHLPDKLPLQQYTDDESFKSAVNGSVAVAVLSTVYDEATLKSAIRRTVCESAHAQILIVADDSAKLLRYDLPSDGEVVVPAESDEFSTLVKRLYLRAYYAATIERYYKVALAIRNREVRLPPEKSETDDKLDTLTTVRERLQSYMQYFRRNLNSDDLEAMENREQRLETLSERAKNSPNPTARGLPESCPSCGLDWTKWHGRRLRNGFMSVGANTWRCTRCSSILADDDPDNYKLG